MEEINEKSWKAREVYFIGYQNQIIYTIYNVSFIVLYHCVFMLIYSWSSEKMEQTAKLSLQLAAELCTMVCSA